MPLCVAEYLYATPRCRDFTFVCPTEILAFNDALAQFQEIETVVLGTSHASRSLTRETITFVAQLLPPIPSTLISPGLLKRATRVASVLTSSFP